MNCSKKIVSQESLRVTIEIHTKAEMLKDQIYSRMKDLSEDKDI